MGLTTRRRVVPPSLFLLGATLVFVSLNLRLPVTSVGPVLDNLRDSVGLSSAGAGLLTTVPVLCFGLASPLAPRLLRGSSAERVLLGSVIAIVGGVGIRLVPQIAPIFAGTILLGIGIAVANVLIPGIIKRDFDNPGPMMGAYAMALNGGAAVGAAFTVPIENATGSWRWALAAWGIPPAVAAIAWAPRAVRAVRDIGAGDGPRISLWRDRTAWMLSAFFACQAATFYGVVAWVPDVLRDAGYSSASAGVLLALVLLFGLPSSAFVPVVAARMRDQWPLAVATGVVWLIGLVGLLLSPGTAPALWMIAMGLAQGAGISLALTLVVLRAPDGAHASVLSGMVQGFGYTVGALGPLVVGVLHDASGGWELSLVLLIVVACALLAFAVAAARPRLVGIGH